MIGKIVCLSKVDKISYIEIKYPVNKKRTIQKREGILYNIVNSRVIKFNFFY